MDTTTVIIIVAIGLVCAFFVWKIYYKQKYTETEKSEAKKIYDAIEKVVGGGVGYGKFAEIIPNFPQSLYVDFRSKFNLKTLTIDHILAEINNMRQTNL